MRLGSFFRIGSLSLRLLLLSSVMSFIALGIGAFALSKVFFNHAIAVTDRELEQLMLDLVSDTQISEQEEVTVGLNIRDTRFSLPYGGWYWQVTWGEPIKAQEGAQFIEYGTIWSSSLLAFKLPKNLELIAGEESYTLTQGPLGQLLRTYHKAWYNANLGKTMVFVVGVDVSKTKALQERFNIYLGLFMALIVLLLLLGQFVQVWLGLEPLRRAQADIKAVRLGQAQRMSQNYPPEIADLSQEINALIEHNGRIVEEARKQVGNLAHGLKTPITVMKNAAEQGGEALAPIVRKQSEQILLQVERYLALARSVAAGQMRGIRSFVFPLAEPLARTLTKIYHDKCLNFMLDIEESLTLPVEQQDLQEILGNLMENAAKWARAEVRLRSDKAGRLIIDDDGPGVPEDKRLFILKRGQRLDEQRSGSGLGLSIVGDLMSAYGGQIILDQAPQGGLRVILDFNMPKPG